MESLEKKLKFVYDGDSRAVRIDTWLSGIINELSRTYIGKLIEEGKILVNGKKVKQSFKPIRGDIAEITISERPEDSGILAENIDIPIIYEDKDIIVADKPKGMVVHPAAGNRTGTLVNALIGKYGNELSDINGIMRPGIVHRLDKDTSGLIVIARNNKAHHFLADLLKNHDIQRIYIAAAEGAPERDEFSVDAPIGRHPVDRLKMAVVGTGKPAYTKFTVLDRFIGKAALIKAELKTGRTHQIRVHIAYAGHPLLGDEVYNPHSRLKSYLPDMKGQMLHAGCISFIHPTTGKLMHFESPLPTQFKTVIEVLSGFVI